MGVDIDRSDGFDCRAFIRLAFRGSGSRWFGSESVTIAKLEREVKISFEGEINMLWTIILVLLVLWALGFGFGGAAVGSLIHILLVVAVVVLILQLVRGSRV